MTPSQRPDLKAKIQALADAVLGPDRVDRDLLMPGLVARLRIEVNDFLRHNPPEFAALRVRDAEILRTDPRFAKVTP